MRGSASSILTECRDLSTARAAEMAARLMDWVPGMLSERAQKEVEPEQKGVYLRAREEARGKGLVVAEEFRRSVEDAFEKLALRSPSQRDPAKNKKLSARELTLVDHEDLSESIRVRDLIRILTGVAGEEIAILQPRVALLANVAELSESDDPLSPQSLCNAFRAACEKFDSDVRVRMVVLDAFENVGIGELERLYRDLNALLLERDVLPVASFRVQKGPTLQGGMATGMQLGAAGGSAAPGASGGGMAAPDLFATLQALVALNAARGPGPLFQPAPPLIGLNGATGFSELPQIDFELRSSSPVPIEGAQLLGALTRLQHGDFAALSAHDGRTSAEGEANLLHGIGQSTLGRGMGAPDAGTLDIVARLFDQIFSDATISPPLRALISRLQFPLLKVALIDKSFFANTQHPARCMLDVLSEFTLDSDSEADTALYQRLENVVERLLESFADDVQVFAPLLEELRGCLEDQTRDADARARKVAEAVERKELRRTAKRRAYTELKERAAGRSVPKAVLKFLMEEWLKLLYLAYCNRGVDSPAWRNALTTLDELIWSLEPKTFPMERRELAAKLPRLLRQLRDGMRAAGTPPHTEHAFLDSIMRRHTALIEGNDQVKDGVRLTTGPILTARESLASNASTELANCQDEPETINATGAESLPSPLEAEQGAILEGAAPRDAVRHNTPGATTAPEVVDNDELVELDFTVLGHQGAVPGMEIKPAFEIEEVEFEAAHGAVEAGQALPAGHSAADMRLGARVEIEQADHSYLPAKLSFISPNGGVYLFTSRGGAQVAEMRFFEVARALRSGAIKLIERVSVFDRAVSGLISALRAQ